MTPLPKKFTDSRGTIERLEKFGVKFNVLHSLPGTYRSGDYHPNIQYDIVLSGRAEVALQSTVGKRTGSEMRTLAPGNLLTIEPNRPHLFYFPKETVLLEWWDGPFSATYYKPYRAIVEAAASLYGLGEPRGH